MESRDSIRLSGWAKWGLYQNFLKDWKGTYLHCDGFSGYKKLEGIILCGGLAHAKRKFHEAWKANESNEDPREENPIYRNFLRSNIRQKEKREAMNKDMP